MKILIAVVVTILGVKCGAAVDPFEMFCDNYEEVELNEGKYYLSGAKLNWYAAYEDCRANHMQLATILTEEDYNSLNVYLSSLGMYPEGDS